VIELRRRNKLCKTHTGAKWKLRIVYVIIPAVSLHLPPSHTSSANSARGTQRNCEYRQCALSGGLSAAARPQKIYKELRQYSAQQSAVASHSSAFQYSDIVKLSATAAVIKQSRLILSRCKLDDQVLSKSAKCTVAYIYIGSPNNRPLWLIQANASNNNNGRTTTNVGYYGSGTVAHPITYTRSAG